MKVLLVVILFVGSLLARENPFEATFKTPPISKESIPFLHITTNKAFQTEHKPIIKKSIPLAVQSAPIIHKPIIKKSIPLTVQPAPIIHKPIQHLVPPIIIVDEPRPVIQHKPIIVKAKKHAYKKQNYKTIYQNYFLKIQTNNRHFKIITTDKLLKKTKFSNPSRMAFDFKRLQYFHTKSILLKNPYARKLTLGTHHDFYRLTLELKSHKRSKITPKPYGYLLTLY